MISVVLPTCNECRNVLEIIPEIRRALGGWNYEIIVADDQSTDGTRQALASFDPAMVRMIDCRQRSLGAAIGRGLTEAKGDVIIVMDSDFNHRPEYLPVLLENLAGYDCVSGSRFLKGGGMTGWMHARVSRLLNLFAARALQGHLTDYTYGFFAVNRGVLRLINFESVFYGHGDYAIRLLNGLERDGARICEIPVLNGPRRWGRPNRSYLQNFFRYIQEIFKLKDQVNS